MPPSPRPGSVAASCSAGTPAWRRRAPDELKRQGAQLVEAELHSCEDLVPALKRYDTVYHVAGATRARSRGEFFRVNADATYHLLSALATSQTPPVVVLVSSLAAAGPSACGQPRCEVHPPAPVCI